jgi:MFS family permease
LATGFVVLLITRAFVGVGEAAYGPAAPTIISDLYPIKRRGLVLSWFYLAIPVGSALGYVVGGSLEAHWNSWRVPFYAVLPPGVLLGVLCFFRRDIRQGRGTPEAPARKMQFRDCLVLLKVPSFILDTLGMAAMTFALGGIAFWMPKYVVSRYVAAGKPANLQQADLFLGVITVVAGIFATMLGGIMGDWLRKRYSGSYFLVSGAAMLLGFPLLLAMLVVPFPAAYVMIFLAVFCLFFNTGPANTILANVTHPSIRATAFSINILVIHLLGDVPSPPLIGAMSKRWGMNFAFAVVSFLILVGGVLWLIGAKYLQRDMDGVPGQLGLANEAATPAYD